MPKINLSAVPEISRCGYPPPLDAPMAGRSWQAIGAAAGLKDFGVNLVRLSPGAWSSQRHWHSHEDELVVALSGELTLVTESGDEILRAGDVAAFPAGVADGHHLVNRSDAEATFIVVGTDKPDRDVCTYPDADLHWPAGGWYRSKDGRPYVKPEQAGS